MNILESFIPVGRNNRPGTPIIGPKFITIHDTANPAVGADALMHINYLKSDECANRPASWHFTVDSVRIVQNLPLTEIAWHAGDGHGPGNMSALAIEICENADGDRAKAEANAAWLAASLLQRFNLPISAVVQHNHWSGKNCPHIIRARENGWEGFLQEVEENMYQMSAEDANKVIAFLKAAYGINPDVEFGRLADELRKASGQPLQNS